LWLDCKDESWEHLPLDFERVSIGVADTGVRRELAEGAFNERVAECGEAERALIRHVPGASCLRDVPLETLREHASSLSTAVRMRAEHVVSEVERAFEARAALLAGDVARLGALMTATHRSLRDSYEVSCPELDVLVEASSAADGGLGARLTGAGFGGCVVLLAEKGAEESVRACVSDAFERAFGRPAPLQFFQGDEGPRRIAES